MPRRRFHQTYQLAQQIGCFDEYPAISEGVDPQVNISRSDRVQPFHLICEKDTMIVLMSGAAKVEFRQSSVNYVNGTPGEMIYVPARIPHRVVPSEETILYRYKAEHAGLEAVAWYCEGCASEVARVTWDTAEELPQEGYLRATAAFNSDQAMRTCDTCGKEHPPVDTTGNRWQEIIDELTAEADEDDDW
ncbi:cupin domain-containing protein [Phaeobacter gallaeciensis]|uniref:3-hydroxyanthranilate 3,4-dioxygenase n=1 Tax=Phaeobacter gallaeciensis TaxID=60890 RepID=A0AAD0EEZ4_9RHOB|nr:hypothetical protein [Phaeobacter gallaeciensis]AHD11884.1 hypothetical protein Gal_04176 [Phaeobacter gallaeciensis DSM 26640]ATE95147.1 3-hydroxyanthranilate 3,4-dioxygenase [Phaeobacter gallaeciensis]ATE99455.1 3-hydroxyanthranilate 3,4-dioxygenase [Phaeobacter gallaeciensis]ATF03852.1 3-hydroxyanthranilate 3,4-dioxygenase [Phaeobacter gallaeciensis]ATF08045.1 3-hydroxyanthranilate 3,4-dioxygenase [Phaeobacter gallaeciensis]